MWRAAYVFEVCACLERFIALSFVKMDAELLAKGEAQLAKNLAIPPKTALFNSLTMDTLSIVLYQESAPDTCSERRLQCSLCFSCSAVFRNHCLVASCCVAIFHFRLSRALSTAFMLDPAAANL